MAAPSAQTVEAAERRAKLADARAREKAAKLRSKLLTAQGAAFEKMSKASTPRRGAGGPSSYAGSYRSAQRKRTRFDSGYALGGPADAHLDPRTHDRLRRDCQELLRNEPSARAIVRCAADMIIGPGPVLQAQTKDKAWNTRAEELWWAWCNNSPREVTGLEENAQLGMCDIRGRQSFTAILNMTVRAMFSDGDELIIKTGVHGGSLQVVEGERIISPNGRGMQSTFTPGIGGIISGVEVDGNARPVRYHLAEYDPRGNSRHTSTTAVPAAEAIFVTSPHMERANQVRGEPAMAAALERFDQLSMLDEAVIEAFRVAACFSAIITSANPGLEQQAWAGETVDRGGDTAAASDHEIEFEPGMAKFAQSGTTVTQMTPAHPSTQYKSFVLQKYSEIGGDIGVPILLAYMDPMGSNFSSFRAALALSFRGFGTWRSWVSSQVAGRIYRWRIASWIRAGLLEFREDWAAHDFVFPPMPVLDPLVEVQAWEKAITAGLATRKEALAGFRGTDRDAFYDEREPELERERAMRLTEPTPGAAQAGTNGQVQSPAQKPETGKDPEEEPDGAGDEA